MTLARLQIVHLRTTGLICGAMVERGVMTPQEAAALFREPMRWLDDEKFDAATVKLIRDVYEQIATDLEGTPRGKPLPPPLGSDRQNF